MRSMPSIPRFGGATGGVINVITKTGTNDFAGTVTGYIRDRGWNGSERPTLQVNSAGTGPEHVTLNEDDERIIEPGITLGGPIMRDRIWFFGAYDRVNIDRTTTNETIFDEMQRRLRRRFAFCRGLPCARIEAGTAHPLRRADFSSKLCCFCSG